MRTRLRSRAAGAPAHRLRPRARRHARRHYWASKRTSTATEFWAAGRGVTGLQNGFAIAGDYMSASSFLGFAA